jgi:hypothetical protein
MARILKVPPIASKSRIRAFSYDQTILAKMSAKSVDGLGPLSDQQIARPEHNRIGLSRLALERHEPHRRPLRRLTDCFGICGVVLLPPHKGLHISQRNQANDMAQSSKLACPVMSTAAGFHRHHTSGLAGKELHNFLAL